MVFIKFYVLFTTDRKNTAGWLVGNSMMKLGSCNETRVISTPDGNEVIGIEAERVPDISEVADQETVTIPAIKTEPNVSCVPVVSATHISYRMYPDLPARISACPFEIKFVWGMVFEQFKKRSLYFVTHCMCSTACSGMFNP
jgi:hypothetical protein